MEMESCVQQWTLQLTPLLEAEERALSERSSLSDEVVYWRNRSHDLENIFEQLKEGVVRQMATTLEEIGSAQSSAFKTLLRRVIAALAEAQDISLHLKPIVKPLEALELADVTEMNEPLRILIHSVALLWCTCAYYRQVFVMLLVYFQT
jgi:dynein heavy chain